MWIEWRKFTNGHWRFKYALLFGTFYLGSLLTIALLNFVTIEGQARQAQQQVEEKSRADRTPSNQPGTGQPGTGQPGTGQPEAGELSSADSEGTTEFYGEAESPRVDVDLSKQTLSIIDTSGDVTLVLPISSGSGKWYVSEGERRKAITPTGRFRVYRKIPGWRKSRLGLMYYPVYIIGGIAIHGSPSVPRRPASHGCIRIPMRAAKAFYHMTPIGTLVVVHE